MPTLDIWSNAVSAQLRALLSSAFACTLMRSDWSHGRPVYVCSPWISDFPIFDNRYRQFDEMVPAARGKSRIRLADVLDQIALFTAVRVISKDTEATRQFVAGADFARSGVKVRMADDALHEKGLLTPDFYLEGSMNLTYSGVYINTEKVSYHAGRDPEVVSRIASAYSELDRRWRQLPE
ncbi:phospholipase D-like domain-containing protein DpdK [Variovorax sp. J22R133]|uniref:phospholipase D-like domain-containing protein DpdK n=1 Tax=Variovorax brevis TaxID=3053503 RepID=UPI002577FC55|nr:phospholipase D-like domain-containing protein DpdK [Variovorax sp. J22R133]MDM0117522.1 phospholipase D-like domain-containing protein DpdK [Variovorax sp. J22R133]